MVIMARQRRLSNASTASSNPEQQQELGSMYDYLAKVILLGPSGAGKFVGWKPLYTGYADLSTTRSCILHRFVKDEWRVLSSQTIGVEFSSKIVKIGTGARRKRVKLQLWDTAGTERFRSVSRSYYRGAAGAILVYDVASHASFAALPTFLMDARALASPNLTVLLAGNKSDLTTENIEDPTRAPPTPSSTSSKQSSFPLDSNKGSMRSMTGLTKGTKSTASMAFGGREVSPKEASSWASKSNIPVAVEVSALSGDNVDELFNRLARIILTKIELGEIDPDDPQSGIQYGDSGAWGLGTSDGGSVRSGMTIDDNNLQANMRKPRKRAGGNRWASGMREWEDVFKLSGSNRRRAKGCC